MIILNFCLQPSLIREWWIHRKTSFIAPWLPAKALKFTNVSICTTLFHSCSFFICSFNGCWTLDMRVVYDTNSCDCALNIVGILCMAFISGVDMCVGTLSFRLDADRSAGKISNWINLYEWLEHIRESEWLIWFNLGSEWVNFWVWGQQRRLIGKRQLVLVIDYLRKHRTKSVPNSMWWWMKAKRRRNPLDVNLIELKTALMRAELLRKFFLFPGGANFFNF